jgi:MFS family permease
MFGAIVIRYAIGTPPARAALWKVQRYNSSPLLLSLISAVASLPFFLFILPAGALADIVDRRKLLWVMNLWLAVAAGALAGLSSLTPLQLVPAVLPELVSNQELPSAVTLGGLQLHIAAIFGPTLGGLLLPLIGANSRHAALRNL